MTTKRSKHELKRLLEDAIATICKLPQPGLWFVIDEVDVTGRPPKQLRLWGTLHFFDRGSPFCCGEPECHLGLFRKRLLEVGDPVRRSMKLRHPVEIEVVNLAICYHDGVTFSYQFVASADDDFA
jgi:hypothetical protein